MGAKMKLLVKPTKSIHGEVRMPRSKTHSFRALVLASLADGTSIIREPKLSNDWHEAVKAMQLFGATIKEIEKKRLSSKRSYRQPANS